MCEIVLTTVFLGIFKLRVPIRTTVLHDEAVFSGRTLITGRGQVIV